MALERNSSYENENENFFSSSSLWLVAPAICTAINCYELRLHERIATLLGPFYNNNSKFKY